MELVQQVPLTVPATFSPESSFPAEVHGYSVSIRVLLAVAAVAVPRRRALPAPPDGSATPLSPISLHRALPFSAASVAGYSDDQSSPISACSGARTGI